jgi:hypothetical protein
LGLYIIGGLRQLPNFSSLSAGPESIKAISFLY